MKRALPKPDWPRCSGQETRCTSISRLIIGMSWPLLPPWRINLNVKAAMGRMNLW